MISKQAIIVGTGCSAAIADQWITAIADAALKFKIAKPRSVAAWLANMGVESSGLTKFEEDLNYSAKRLAEVWPNRYAIDRKAKVKVPNAKAIALSRKPQDIANDVYANRMGNGPAESGDGWRFRGQGPFQITGRDNLDLCGKAIGFNLLDGAEEIHNPTGGALSAAWYFVSRGCDKKAEANDFPGVVELINGAPPSEANHGELRTSRYFACLEVISFQ